MKNGRSKAYEYTAFFEANEHRGYTVTVPALPGLVTEGKNLEHAREMAKDAIRCYIGRQSGRLCADSVRGVGDSKHIDILVLTLILESEILFGKTLHRTFVAADNYVHGDQPNIDPKSGLNLGRGEARKKWQSPPF